MANTVFSWAKTLTEIWYLLMTGKFLFWTFRWWEIRSFFESRSWWKDDIYWLLRGSCFELFGDGKYRLFFSQKVDGKMIFAWYFWAFYDIPGNGQNGFSRSVQYMYEELLETTWKNFSACLIDNLFEVFGCSIITDFISRLFGFSTVFGWWVITFDFFNGFVGFFQISDW